MTYQIENKPSHKKCFLGTGMDETMGTHCARQNLPSNASHRIQTTMDSQLWKQKCLNEAKQFVLRIEEEALESAKKKLESGDMHHH